MIVVCDTSPLNYLVLVNAIDILPKLFDEIHVPPGVILELQHPRTPATVRRWTEKTPGWLHITAPSISLSVTNVLDLGEAQAISLAQEFHAQAILIDERKGRRVARNLGFKTLGTITVLELAARENLLDLKSAYDALRQTSFQVTTDLLDAALARDAAHKLSE